MRTSMWSRAFSERLGSSLAAQRKFVFGHNDARMVRTYTHLAAIDLLDHANAIRLPAISPTVPVSTDPELEGNLNVISGVDEGIRTPNNRNHNPGLYR